MSIDMKGVVLAGGLGTRLGPLTRVTNKHLLPVYDRPMVFHPLKTLVDVGIRDVMLVTGGRSPGDFLRLLGNGRELGLRRLQYAYQEGEGGIAAALSLAEDFVDDGPVAVVLGDNIFEDNLSAHVESFLAQEQSARVVLARVGSPEHFGVARFEFSAETDSVDGTEHTLGRVAGIIEKPEVAPSPYAVTGFYMYDSDVFDIIRGLRPSGRKELEITDVNNEYIRKGELEYGILDGWWIDAGSSPLNLARATRLVMKKEKVCDGSGCGKDQKEDLEVCV
jgi:glucose-1-phosphate thymidylyltransferase